jgi:hypothetical protein
MSGYKANVSTVTARQAASLILNPEVHPRERIKESPQKRRSSAFVNYGFSA